MPGGVQLTGFKSSPSWAARPSSAPSLFANLDPLDADLMVVGAFRHSRLPEYVSGGMTLDLIHQQSQGRGPTSPRILI